MAAPSSSIFFASSSGERLPSAAPARPQRRRRNKPRTPSPDTVVIALSPESLTATYQYVCEVCNKAFQRDQNLRLHRRSHDLSCQLKPPSREYVRKIKVYICPVPDCVHHNPARALADLTGIKKHFSRKHGEKKFRCDKCDKPYAARSDWRAHTKVCGSKVQRCSFKRTDLDLSDEAAPQLTMIPSKSLNKIVASTGLASCDELQQASPMSGWGSSLTLRPSQQQLAFSQAEALSSLIAAAKSCKDSGPGSLNSDYMQQQQLSATDLVQGASSNYNISTPSVVKSFVGSGSGMQMSNYYSGGGGEFGDGIMNGSGVNSMVATAGGPSTICGSNGAFGGVESYTENNYGMYSGGNDSDENKLLITRDFLGVENRKISGENDQEVETNSDSEATISAGHEPWPFL